MTKRYDPSVVGAGPAGLMAARTAAENGLNAALQERKTEIPRIRRLDGGAMGINGYLFGQHATIIPRAKSLFLPTPGFSVPSDGVPFSNSCGFPVYSTGGKRLRLSTGVHPVPGRCNQGGGCYEVRGSALDVAMEIEGGKQRIKGLV